MTRRERQAETRKQVIAAARALFLEAGFHGTTLSAVVAAAGFTKGAVYSNFSSKAELAMAVIQEVEQENVGRLIEVIGGIQDAEQRGEAIKAWGESVLDGMDLIRLRAEINFASLDDPVLAEVIRTKSRNLRAMIAALLRETGDEEAFLLPADQLADVLLALSNGVGMQRLIDPAFDLQVFVDPALLLTGDVPARERGPW